ncbi:proton-coupled folate transporter-like [Vanessa atalanta]|uniref:proton-coupled folate transporter-like n=1 Tax=Vanessa atalanta TaxID=42275 RepID=UPI001FCCF9C2|nr:proton-coupled folate transporter-like [Vanessa atalanta]
MAETEKPKSVAKADKEVEENTSTEETNEESPLKLEHGNDNNKVNVTKKITFREKLKLIKDNITVEPIMACYIMPSVLASLATQNLNLEKVCRVNLNYSIEICDALKSRQTENFTEYEENVQTYTAGIQAWKNIVQTAIPVLIILFVGAWSDKTGRRKACILMPIVGEFITCVGFIINTYYFYELPAEVTALTESIFPAITGGWFTNFIGVFSYIGDITTTEDRTYRVGIVNLCMSLGYPIGSALSGVLLTWIGYYGIFSLSASLYLCSLLYGYFCLEDPKKKQVKNKNHGCIGFLREFFDVSLVKETFKVAFKSDNSNRRVRVCLLLIVVCVVFGPMQGEFTILYLFTRFRFNWDEVKFSIWSTYSIITNLLGTAFSISLFSNYLKLDDTLLGIISCTSKIVASFAYAFARNDLEIYLAPLLEILNGTSFIAMRSIASKLVSGEEFGKVNSLFGLAEAMTPLVYGPLYSRVYIETLNILPGAVFLLGALLTVPAIIIFGWLYFEHKKDKAQEDIKINDKEKCQSC